MPPSGVDYASRFLNGYAPEYVQRNCSATCGDVTLVLTELMDVIRDHLLNGEEVTIDGLGSFRVGVTSDVTLWQILPPSRSLTLEV